MSKRERAIEAAIRFVVAMLGLGWLVWQFIPNSHPYLIAVFVTLGAGLSLAVGLWFRGRRTDVRASDAQPAVHPAGNDLPVKELTPQSLPGALRRLDWFQFEKLVAAIYRGYGDSVERLGGAHPDGGVDLIVTAKTGRFVVQCKIGRAHV